MKGQRRYRVQNRNKGAPTQYMAVVVYVIGVVFIFLYAVVSLDERDVRTFFGSEEISESIGKYEPTFPRDKNNESETLSYASSSSATTNSNQSLLAISGNLELNNNHTASAPWPLAQTSDLLSWRNKHLIASLDWSKPLYVLIGMSSECERNMVASYLRTGYLAFVVDESIETTQLAEQTFQKEVDDHQAVFLPILISFEKVEDDASQALKGNQSWPTIEEAQEHQQPSWYTLPFSWKSCTAGRCNRQQAHDSSAEVDEMSCQIVLSLLFVVPSALQVDIRRQGTATCLKALRNLADANRPKHVCWNAPLEMNLGEKPNILIHQSSYETWTILDHTRMILDLAGIGYTFMKVSIEGPTAWQHSPIKGVSKLAKLGFLTNKEAKPIIAKQQDYRSHEYYQDRNFDTNWIPVTEVLKEGLFSIDSIHESARVNNNFLICMATRGA